MATYGIEPFDLVVSNLYPFAQDPGIETIDVGGPAMVRAAAKNHAFVTVVTDASQYAPLLEEMDANDNTVGDDTRRAFAVAAFASTAAFDAQIVSWLAGGARAPHLHRPRARAHRRGAALRREPAPARGALPHQRHVELVGRRRAARRPRAQLPQPLRRRRRVADGARFRRSNRRSRSSSTPTRVVSRSPTTSPTGVPARARVRRALRVRRHRRAQPRGRHRHRRAHGRRTAGRPDHRARLGTGHDRHADRQAQEHPPPQPPACPSRRPSTSARSAAASSCRTRTTSSPPATTGASSPSGPPPTPSGATPSWRGASAGT